MLRSPTIYIRKFKKICGRSIEYTYFYYWIRIINFIAKIIINAREK